MDESPEKSINWFSHKLQSLAFSLYLLEPLLIFSAKKKAWRARSPTPFCVLTSPSGCLEMGTRVCKQSYCSWGIKDKFSPDKCSASSIHFQRVGDSSAPPLSGKINTVHVSIFQTWLQSSQGQGSNSHGRPSLNTCLPFTGHCALEMHHHSHGHGHSARSWSLSFDMAIFAQVNKVWKHSFVLPGAYPSPMPDNLATSNP